MRKQLTVTLSLQLSKTEIFLVTWDFLSGSPDTSCFPAMRGEKTRSLSETQICWSLLPAENPCLGTHFLGHKSLIPTENSKPPGQLPFPVFSPVTPQVNIPPSLLPPCFAQAVSFTPNIFYTPTPKSCIALQNKLDNPSPCEASLTAHQNRSCSHLPGLWACLCCCTYSTQALRFAPSIRVCWCLPCPLSPLWVLRVQLQIRPDKGPALMAVAFYSKMSPPLGRAHVSSAFCMQHTVSWGDPKEGENKTGYSLPGVTWPTHRILSIDRE